MLQISAKVFFVKLHVLTTFFIDGQVSAKVLPTSGLFDFRRGSNVIYITRSPKSIMKSALFAAHSYSWNILSGISICWWAINKGNNSQEQYSSAYKQFNLTTVCVEDENSSRSFRSQSLKELNTMKSISTSCTGGDISRMSKTHFHGTISLQREPLLWKQSEFYELFSTIWHYQKCFITVWTLKYAFRGLIELRASPSTYV